MADPLSISASIIAVLQLTGTVVQYLNDVKAASEDRQRILAEVSSTSGVLFLLKDLAERAQWEDGWSVTIKSLNLPGGPLDKFKMVLQQLVSKLKSVVGVKKIGKALIWPFQKGEINEILIAMHHQKTIFSLALQNDHIELSRYIKTDVESLHYKVDEVNRGLDEVKINQTAQESRIQDQEFQRILTWLSPLDFPVQQSDFISRRQEGTGKWIFESSEFKTWLGGTGETLFCPGIPGAGKTILASIVINYLSKIIHAQDIGVAYVFCAYRNRLEQTTICLLASLLKQLLQQRHVIPEDLKNLYKHYIQRSTFSTITELSRVLEFEMRGYSKVFIVVDALDECADEGGARELLISKLNALQSTNALNLMITSRPILKIEQRFQKVIKMEIRASDADVQKYLEGHMSQLSSCVLSSTSLQEIVKSNIIKAAAGMFLLAQLHLDSLIDKTSPKAIKKALKTLPKGFDALGRAYDEAMERIYSQRLGLTQLAMQVLSWATYAVRPLTVLELQHALAVELDEPGMDEENISSIEELVSVCAGLVTVDQESNIVRLVHYTTQECLEIALLDHYADAQQDITMTCLTYLLFNVFKDGICQSKELFESRLKQNPFFDYAAHYWSFYSQELRKEKCQGLALKFLMDDLKVTASSQALFYIASLNRFSSSRKRFSGIHLVAYFGIESLIDPILEKRAELESKDGCFEKTPLLWAAGEGYEATVELLLERGAEIDSEEKYGLTSLSLAATSGHQAVVALLLKEGAELYSKDKDGWTSLCWAAAGGHETVSKLLFEKGAKLDSMVRFGLTKLWLATELGYEPMVAFLESVLTT